jgi:hypothetical protein
MTHTAAGNASRSCRRVLAFLLLLALDPFAVAVAAGSETPRRMLSLEGPWEFQRDGATGWKTVNVPSSFQSHEGTNFHGVGWYHKELGNITVPAGQRVLLHFQAAATEAEVWLDDKRLGSHLGGWTPFRFDITDLVKSDAPGQHHLLKVRLDEKVGHNTQGFLPIIAPHFGGLWQGVFLLYVPDTYMDDLQLLAAGDPAKSEFRLEIPLAGNLVPAVAQLHLRYRLRGEEQWTQASPSVAVSNHTLIARAPVAAPRLWAAASPNLYELDLSLPGPEADRLQARAAFRSIETFGPEFRLNGKPLQIRGVLNWGFSPPRVEPNPGEDAWRLELEFARDHGFNLMKFCLWVPPPRYLELADEMGMLTWMEYPTWHPDFSAKHLDALRQEFREFFWYDRNHPSILLRSLTCETGPSADLKVIQSLYDTAHDLVPGALVEDDSSWIGWNRVHDFYDDHPYGNNHTWVGTLQGFNEYILAHGIKPMVLGEAIAADTWIDREALLKRFGSERPWYAPGVLDESGLWLERMRRLAGPGGLDRLLPDSLRYGLLMRKYQAESYRREVPYGAYVISVIRDIPNASMGLLDYLNRSKWATDEWRWQRDTICLLKTEADRRSFASGEPLTGDLLLSHFGLEPIKEGRLRVTLETSGPTPSILQSWEQKGLALNPGTLARALQLDYRTPEIAAPTQLVIRARLETAAGTYLNEWPIWIVPTARNDSLRDVRVHGSLSAAMREGLFPGCSRYDGVEPAKGVVVAARFDEMLVKCLEGGGRVLFLPDGQEHSLARSAHWFLRGAPYIPGHILNQQVPRDLFLELQAFDLAADVVPNLPCLDSFSPILMLWDTHDQPKVSTHGVLFETRAAAGRLLVSAARHDGQPNAAGRWLLGVLLDHLRSGEAPRQALDAKVWEYLKSKLTADQTNLVARAWKFHPDPNGEGLSQGWHLPSMASEDGWKDIRIGAWWESQGYPALDGWAWYRLWVDVPQTWQGRDVFLSFEGVDDIYELYINGEVAGKGGDLATRKDALQEKKSHNITRLVKPGQKALIAVRVYDWYGAGGIFRPVTLGTLPFQPDLDLLK